MEPEIRKLGTIDCDLVETTPVVFRQRLFRFEYVRAGYWGNTTGDSYFRFVDHETHVPSVPFARGYHLGNVFCENDVLYVTGTNTWDGERVDLFVSRDMVQWESSPLNPVLRAADDDRRLANPRLPADLQHRIATAVNINNSDIDFCEFRGQVVINYSWGNQQGIEHLAEAVFDGTEDAFLRAWFPG